ncbi:riboflavin synthase [Lactiplantibacillus mudanjiangensis]|uniref:Riboflavin synthase n=1 Tax=Lactiplantibacillus mudanjiangensis TaxID=1296538 RepID=A0A660E584_9LACO|nr:riboflavin synthase [Lactiplantibacillus mudanjiangensis]VDG20018.1 riboflavin synthase [Lactobacillus pentosus] [Lactiplantibacillus mudanjiangensis]VDG26179.1 riboflavin synthase [Lactobacillus pentosus] [Lactiplantibacillus mudanjiangensis]VDG27331.1 riboflavin synthase [Lactobacillus pentosus] [Lactiplantibacillus mudanjiangensis]
MFTGIVQTKGHVKQVQRQGQTLRLTITAADIVTPDLKLGDSIAVNGVCLTATQLATPDFTVEVMPESVRRTNLGQLRPGQLVNLERALAANGRLDGHFVLGHVDYLSQLIRRQVDQNAIKLFFKLPAAYQPYVVEKGSVAIDGVSLTIVTVTATSFEIDLIPHSQQATTLGSLKLGCAVNIETDVLGKYLVKQTQLKGTY